MKLRCTSKKKKFLLLGIIPAVYVISTILYVPAFLKNNMYTNLYGGAFVSTHSAVDNDYDHENVKSTLQRLLSVSVEIRDNRFIDSSIFSINEKRLSDQSLSIAWINKPKWLNLPSLNLFLSRRCSHKNCKMIEFPKDTIHPDALVFDTKTQLPNSSSSAFKQRPANQIWVFFQMEPPSRITTNWFRQESFTNAFNWSWSYRLDSDIFRPIGTFERSTKFSNSSYSAVFKKKTKMAAWIVSHCNTQSNREEYVSSLIREGVQVDIFGACSKTGQRADSEFIMNKISQEYKFYIAFENSFCEDYVTEKLFSYYSLDVILIVRGGLNYSNFFDKSTFIDSSDFGSVKELARLLQELGSNEEAYTQYLRNKEKFTQGFNQWDTLKYSSCALCKKLSSVDEFSKVYKDIEKFVANETCTRPNDYY